VVLVVVLGWSPNLFVRYVLTLRINGGRVVFTIKPVSWVLPTLAAHDSRS